MAGAEYIYIAVAGPVLGGSEWMQSGRESIDAVNFSQGDNWTSIHSRRSPNYWLNKRLQPSLACWTGKFRVIYRVWVRGQSQDHGQLTSSCTPEKPLSLSLMPACMFRISFCIPGCLPSHCVVSVTSDSHESSCLSFLSAGIAGPSHHTGWETLRCYYGDRLL